MDEKPVYIESETGLLEGRLIEQPVEITEAFIVCHAHPLHGGKMDNKVPTALTSILSSLGYHTLRYNMRGVGKSSGEYANDTGELLDLTNAMKFLADTYPNLEKIHLAGYSYGAYLCSHVASKDNRVGHLVMISPPLSVYTFLHVRGFKGKKYVMCGDKDQYTKIEQLEEMMNYLNDDVEVKVVENTDHYYLGKVKRIKDWLKEHIPMIFDPASYTPAPEELAAAEKKEEVDLSMEADDTKVDEFYEIDQLAEAEELNDDVQDEKKD
jgi:uncharacterized protein